MTTLNLFLPPRPNRFAQELCELAPLLQRVAHKLCGRPDDARDLVQDTLERALRAGSAPNPNLKAWLLSILQHRFIDLWRRRAYVHTSDALETLAAEPAPAADEEPRWAGIDDARIRAAVDRLHPNYREVFVLHALEGRAYTEVAEQMGIPKATVGTRLFRARARLKMILEGELARTG
jgi:RNA polymerase sigma-70 factor (ECF subfamily)